MTSGTTSGTVRVPVAKGRALGSWRSAWLVVEGMWTWYRRNWRSTLFSSFVSPVLFLLALGIGFGSQVRPGTLPGGVTYLEFLTPAMLAVSSIQIGAFETSYPVLAGFKWQRQYWAVTASPISPGQLVSGQLLFVTLRILFSGLAYLAVAALFGGAHSALVLLALPFAVLCGMAFAAPLCAYSATITNEGESFNAVFRFLLMPMVLFSGTFFPIGLLPIVIRPLAWLSPLWHGTELARGITLGTLRLWPALGHTAYLGALVVGGLWLARRMFERRLAQ